MGDFKKCGDPSSGDDFEMGGDTPLRTTVNF